MGKKRHKKKNTNHRGSKSRPKLISSDSIQLVANVLTIITAVIQLYQFFR